MWGCLKWMVGGTLGFFALLFLIIGGGWWYLGSSSFAGLVRLRIEKTLEARLGREVDVGDVRIERGRQSRVIINDLRVANLPGAAHPYFATVRQLIITGGIDSFWSRKIRVGRIDLIEPRIYFEVFPAGSKFVHNFPHWQTGPKSRYEIYHLDLGTLYAVHGAFEFLDRRHNIAALATNVSTTVQVTSKADLYAGVANSPLVQMRIQDYEPFNATMRGQFRYTPNVLDLQSVALEDGPDLRVFLSGRVSPLADGVYNLRLTSDIALNRVRHIFRIQKPLDGTLAMDTMLRGKQGDFTLNGGWVSPRLHADAYEMTNARGTLNVTGNRTVVDVQRAQYGGGTISAHYLLPQYAEPYPMSVDLRYNGVSLEKLFSDWGVQDTGLRGAATGRLGYHWNKDRVLAGGGEGSATLSKSTVAFSNARYPVPLGGSTDFALANGVVTFRRAELVTDASRVTFTGKFRIEDAWTDLLMQIHSRDFAELDRLGYNLAHSAGKKAYTLLGLGGAGDISGTMRGKIKEPDVVAKINAAGTKFNDVALGNAEIDLRYDGVKSVMTFERAVFREGSAHMSITGPVGFPARGPSPQFDLAIDAVNYPVDRAVAAVNLKFVIKGVGTGKLLVTGTPDEGKVTFVNLAVHQPKGDLRLNGTVVWKPGKGNAFFDLDIAATSFPVPDIIAFLDLGKLPVTGDLTGKLHIGGPKNKLEGSGGVTVNNGTLYGEPVTTASANIVFTQGTLNATNLTVVATAGTVTGEAQMNFDTNQFSYSIASSNIDLSKLKVLSSLAGLLGGHVTLTSTGAGTLDQPEVVLQATLNEASLRGLSLPSDAPPPQIYLAIRNGQLIVRGSAANVLTIDGNGSVAADGTLGGLVRIKITDIARAVAMSPKTASLPAAGGLTADLQLGGKLSSIEALRIDATFPEFDLRVSEHKFTPARPLRLSLRDGRIVFDDFQLALSGTQSTFGVAGFVELGGAKRMNVDVRGTLEAALLQLFVPDLRADGHVVIAGGVHGTLDKPAMAGTAEFQNAQVRFPGFPQLIDNITGTLIFRGDRIEIDALRARVGGGTVAAGGSIALDGLAPKSARVTLQGTDVAIRYFEGLTVEGTFTLLLSGDAERFVLQGDVDVARALYFRDMDIGTSLLSAVLARRGPAPLVAANWQNRVGLRLHLTAPGTLAVRNNLADVTGSADLDVTGTLAVPSVIGSVTLNEGGRVRFQSIDYRVVRGTINFQNPFRIDPYFDVTVEARVSGGLSEIESGPLDVSVTLTGTLDRISPTITSDPPASDITLFSLLGFGSLSNRTGASSPLDATLAGRSLLYQSISMLGSRSLSFIDAFSVDPGNIDKTGDTGPKVSLEKRISNSLRAFVIYSTKDGRKRIVLEWQVNTDWVLQFMRDEMSNQYTVEARFRRRYEGYWAWGTRGRNPLELFATFHNGNGNGNSNGNGRGQAAPQMPPEATATTPVAPPQGANVVSVALSSDARIDTSTMLRYVTVKPGQPLSIRAVQNSIKSLFATGDFRDVHVNAQPVAGGVNVMFALFTNFRVTAISFDGLGGADRERALREATFHLGDVLSLNAVDHSAVAIQEFLNRAGYLEAAVDPETTFIRGQGRATVTFHVARGPRATVGQVALVGDVSPFTPQEVVKQMKRGPGKPFEINAARDDANRMRTWLVRRNFRKADVRFEKYIYDKPAHTVALQYTANAGPIVQVAVTGVSPRSLRGLLPFKKTQPYSEDVIDRAANDIVTHLQQQGFFNAAVDTEEHLTGNVWTTTFHVNPGSQFRLQAVAFTGNQKVSDKDLAKVVQTSPRRGILRSLLSTIFRRPAGGVTRAQLNADREALESYYRLNGFSQVQVDTPVVHTDTATEAMTVEFPIVEGPQTLVAEVVVEGNEKIATKDLPKPALKRGEPLNPQLEETDSIALRTFYADRGYAEVQVRTREEVSPDKTSARVTYAIAEGPKVSVGDVVVRGNTYTKSSVVLRTSQLEKGQPFSFLNILEAQRNLYRLGIFQRVDVQPEQTGTSLSERNVTISVQEGKDLTLSGSAGVTTPVTTTALSTSENKPSLLGSVSVAHRNLFGTARYLGLELIGARNRQEAFLTYREPYVGPYQIPVQLTVFQSDNLRRGAHLRQSGTFIEATRIARYQTRWSLRYEYRISKCIVEHATGDICSLAEQALLPGLDRSVTNIQISSVTQTFFWDKRDDTIDPHHGFFTNASIEYAFKALRADAKFLKEFAQASWYVPVSARSVFAISGRAGLIHDLGTGMVVDSATGELRRITGVPLSERFTGGGETSHRGFPLDLLGATCADPRDAGNCRVDELTHRLIGATLIDLVDDKGNHTIAPLGGKSIFIVNAEYRFPIAGPFGGTVFTDAGNVFAETKIRFGDLRWGVGGGMRYLSPVGPVRFDIGYNLRRRILRFDESGKPIYEQPLVYFITLGYAF